MNQYFDAFFLKRAIELASYGADNGHGGPFGAVIVKNGKIISEGYNKVTSSNDPTAHAEVVAIRQACEALGEFQLTGCQIYCSCEPCPMCLGAIYWSRPDAVFYAGTRHDAAVAGFDDEFIYKELDVVPSGRAIPMIHVADDEAGLPFKKWAANPGKISY